MQCSLYEYYRHSHLNLYQVRKHYVEHFYCQCHGRNEAEKVLRNVMNSNKIGNIINHSLRRKTVPSYTDFLTTICGMMKFMFKPNETLTLATMDAALRWDMEINSQLHLITPEELMSEMVQVFNKFHIYGETTEAIYHTTNTTVMSTKTVDESQEESEPSTMMARHPDIKANTWSFLAFTEQFGPKVHVSEFCRKDDGGIFHSCIFTDRHKCKTFVGFSSKLGVLTAEEISERENDLVVIKSPSGNYNLYPAQKEHRWKEVKVGQKERKEE